MKSDFLLAITQLSAEKNLPSEVVLSAVEAALSSAYRKDNFAANQNITVKINPTTGKVQVWAEKTVVKKVTDPIQEISLKDAKAIKADAEIDEPVMVESTPANAGRIAAQTAKQVILQRLHEAEHSAIFEEYAGREGEIVTGLVQRIESRQIFVDLGRTEAILPAAEQVPGERYRIGQRVKVSILEVVRTNKGPRVILTRSHPDLLRRLFEMEIPEIFNGTVKIQSVAREAGYRSKVAVSTDQDGIDPVGCCVGLRGIRIQNIVNELNGEKIDVVMWSQDSTAFIANALSPAQIMSVTLNEEDGVATVIVPDRQLSLAIGREGQNVRLAAKLTGWRIDIKSASAAEAEKAEEPVEEEEAEAPAPVEELVESVVAEPDLLSEEELKELIEEDEEEEAAEEEEPEEEAEEEEEEEEPELAEPVSNAFDPSDIFPSLDSDLTIGTVPNRRRMQDRPQIRFAEDIMNAPVRSQSKKKKKKKSGKERDSSDQGTGKKARRDQGITLDEGDDT